MVTGVSTERKISLSEMPARTRRWMGMMMRTMGGSGSSGELPYADEISGGVSQDGNGEVALGRNGFDNMSAGSGRFGNGVLDILNVNVREKAVRRRSSRGGEAADDVTCPVVEAGGVRIGVAEFPTE
jgi:hypothetical protein